MPQGEQHIIQVGEHTFTTPPEPKKKDILFSDLPKKEQYWQRYWVVKDIPKFFFDWHKDVEEDAQTTVYDKKKLISLSAEDTTTLIYYRDREIQRMLEGIWFMNNGTPTYITGGYYGILTWLPILDSLNDIEVGSQYGRYMRFQRDYLYVKEVAKKTTVAKGLDTVKPKKTGITAIEALDNLVDSMTHRNAFYRIMNTKEEVAKKINFNFISYAVEKLPNILTPEYRKNLGAIYFENSDTTAKRSSRRKSEIEYLNSTIETVATINNGFDSGKNRIAWVDEESKIKDGASPQDLHNITLNTVMQGLIRIGTIIYTHYVSEKNDKSFRQAKKIYYDSKLRTIDKDTGQTKSGLICYAMTVLDGIFGAVDKYGEPELDKIWAEINAKHRQYKDDPAALRAYRRQMPTCEADMWQEGAGEDSVFDNMRLGEQLQKLTEDSSLGMFPYLDFNFEWTVKPHLDEIRHIYEFTGQPRIVPVTDKEKITGKQPGLWKWYNPEWTPQEWLKKHVNYLAKDKKGNLMPRADNPFYASCDPTQYSGAKDVVVGSKNALHVFLLPNVELDGVIGKKVSNKRLMVEYFHRADSPSETLNHVIQTIMYFGCYILVEGNAIWLYTRLKEMGFANFLIVMNKETNLLEPYKEFVEHKPFTSQKSETGQTDTISDYVMAGKVHINESDPIDNVEVLKSEVVVEQLMNFDTGDTKQYDAAVCYLEGLMGMNAFMGWREGQKGVKKQGDRNIGRALAGILH